MLAQPSIGGFHAMEFELNLDQKWHAVVEGFISTVDALLKSAASVFRQITRDALLRLRSKLFAIDIKSIKKRCCRTSRGRFPQGSPSYPPLTPEMSEHWRR